MKVPFLDFQNMNSLIREDLMSYFKGFLDSGYYVLGNNLKSFEEEYAIFNEVKYSVGVSNGLDALILCLRALNIRDGDEVIVPSNTYIATVLAILNVGARPVFIEPNIKTYNIDPDNIESKITSKTKGIIPVHLYGQPCEMDRIMEISRKYGIYVIEDNAQSHGAKYKEKMTGSWGDLNATSFYPGKNLGALGDAGAITTNSENYADLVRTLRNYGSRVKYVNELIGYNMRLDEFQAGVLSIKLRMLKKWTNERQQLANLYIDNLSDLQDVTLPYTLQNASHSYHLFVIRIEQRNDLQEFLSNKGIQTLIHYPIPPHLQNALSNLGFKKGDFPIAEKLAETMMSLPLWPGLESDKVSFICDTIRSFYK
jgi:dTDP-4-amino-4,6-dideoxygalactose transaminase